MDENKKITISFAFDDKYGNNYYAKTSAEVFTDLGETEIDFIGEQLNIFLQQCGYLRENRHIFMEDVTEEELTALSIYLGELRGEK